MPKLNLTPIDQKARAYVRAYVLWRLASSSMPRLKPVSEHLGFNLFTFDLRLDWSFCSSSNQLFEQDFKPLPTRSLYLLLTRASFACFG